MQIGHFFYYGLQPHTVYRRRYSGVLLVHHWYEILLSQNMKIGD